MAGLLSFLSDMVFGYSNRHVFVELLKKNGDIHLLLALDNKRISKLLLSSDGDIDNIDKLCDSVYRAKICVQCSFIRLPPLPPLSPLPGHSEDSEYFEDAENTEDSEDSEELIASGDSEEAISYDYLSEKLTILQDDNSPGLKGRVCPEMVIFTLDRMTNVLDLAKSLRKHPTNSVEKIGVELKEEGGGMTPWEVNLYARIGTGVLKTTIIDGERDRCKPAIDCFKEVLAELKTNSSDMQIPAWYAGWRKKIYYNTTDQTLVISVDQDPQWTTYYGEHPIARKVLQEGVQEALNLLRDYSERESESE